MTDPVTISAEQPENKGMDYVYLKEEGTRIVQALSGTIWTDYNEHDPGVTTLEQLAYALTELSYRAELPIPDLLARKDGRDIDPRRHGLYVPLEIFPVNPCTVDDYRKLIVDRVAGVNNVWLYSARDTTYAEECDMPPVAKVNGLYDIWIYAPGSDECATDEQYRPGVIEEQVRRVYSKHRNLGEDVRSIRRVQGLPTRVYADLSIDDAPAPASILAHVMFNLGTFMAPELRRTPLGRMVAAGRSADEIFNGPLLRHGFIRDDQLTAKASTIWVRDIVDAMVNTRGVRGVRSATVEVDVQGLDPCLDPDGGQYYTVPRCDILEYTPYAGGSSAFTIRLFRDGVEIQPAPARVQRELDTLWAEYRRTYPLAAQYDEYFAFPQGTYQDVEAYYSIQNQYPNVYGINDYGVPAEAPAVRKGQAKQLKGYLLAFEQLLANFLAQLAGVRQLYAVEPDSPYTYFFQYLNRSVPDVEPLLARAEGPDTADEAASLGYRRGLARLVHDHDPHVARRNRFLDVLLAMYAEAMDSSSVFATWCGLPDRTAQERLAGAKSTLLRDLVPATARRGRGFDYLDTVSPRNVAGMTIKSRIQLGMSVFEPRALVDILDELAIDLVDTEDSASIGRLISRHGQHIDETFVPLSSVMDSSPDSSPDSAAHSAPAEPSSVLLRGQRITEGFTMAASAIEHYRLGVLPGEQSVTVVCKSPGDADWRLVCKYAAWQDAVDDVQALIGAVTMLNGRSQQLYIVEHTLLRFAEDGASLGPAPAGNPDPGSPATPEDFSYSFTITAVISTCARLRHNAEFRVFAREVIRQNTPAHIVAECCFLTPGQLRSFEPIYFAWRLALRLGDQRQIIATSRQLRDFLCQCAKRGESAAAPDARW